MNIHVGSTAPDFTLPSTRGTPFCLSKDIGSSPLVLYFYPKDFTPLCTEEACSFRDTFDAFKTLSVPVIGVSSDDIETHQRFKAAHNLPFELLSDPKAEVAKLYGAVMPIVGMIRRKTFLVSPTLTIMGVYENNFSAEGHVKEILALLRHQQQTKRA
jgi:peroxiredoxin Q/BCP